MSAENKRPIKALGGSQEEPKAKKVKLEPLVENQAKPGRKRKRHRKLYKSIVDQMNFYFSDCHLSKSHFLAIRLERSPWIDLSIFLKFNKLVDMLKLGFGRVDLEDLWTALNVVPSQVFNIREEGDVKQIGKAQPLQAKDPEATEKCTVYVENLPPFVTIDSLRALFEKYGPVDYVSLPRYKHNLTVKGFAFIEFKEEEDAKSAIEKNTKYTPDDPADLQTVKAYNIEQALEKGQEEVDDNEEETTPSRKKRQKKTNQHQEDDNHLLSTFRIMSKTEWRRLRNKYLNLQKRNMSLAKAKIRQMQGRSSRVGGVAQTPEPEPEETSAKPEGGVEFVKGVIVKFNLNEPVIENGKQFKARIRASVMEPVKYVDATNGQMQMYVRCASTKQAELIAGAKGIVGVAGVILSGDEETDYWSKIRQDRSDKLSGKVQVSAPKVRGKDRLVKKFETVVRNTHQFFDDAND